MASGSSGRPTPGSKGFDFASDDILCSYDEFSNQDAASGTHSDPSIGTHSTMLNNNRLLFKTMSINRYLGFIVFLLLLNLGSSSFISETVFESYRSTGRSLLQTQKNCPINFENQNYTIITSQCKGPRYAADTCCKAFKEFACPFSEELNDMSNNCASTMFSYINLYGKYPPGIFANECKEGKNGLECDEKSANAVSKDSKSSSGHSISVLSPVAVVVIFASSLVSLFCLF